MKEQTNSILGTLATGSLWAVSKTLQDDAKFIADVATAIAGTLTSIGIMLHWWNLRQIRKKHEANHRGESK